MIVLSTKGWEDYELLDSGDGKRLERFGKFILIRPDPQIIWKPKLGSDVWNKADAIFKKGSKDKGKWEVKTQIPEKWELSFEELRFFCKLSPFKHTGVFPEQSLHWQWIIEKIKSAGRKVNTLNLFGYTGISSLAAASVGSKVTHIDASYSSIGWARENQKASQLVDKPIRWILDDCLKFCQREAKRGIKYDCIIMDPPIYGHGPKGEIWSFNESFPKLLEVCQRLLSPNPLFVLVNAYAVSSSCLMLENVLNDYLKSLDGKIESGELALEEKDSERLLSTGIFARWTKSA